MGAGETRRDLPNGINFGVFILRGPETGSLTDRACPDCTIDVAHMSRGQAEMEPNEPAIALPTPSVLYHPSSVVEMQCT